MGKIELLSQYRGEERERVPAQCLWSWPEGVKPGSSA